ncbi:DUF6683 family protein [Vandammella animalimorsus]|uniref:Uncharacterized protein n=1 Tax=Vandammella animalimorsus TaxID=2029117 RepID=A0A2A2AF58_9BURK|nr:DUF6683 family protein [Vandammella animalimorsus]PAT36368.1 hypothetical protein CK625_11295 [Vandammella animalimorsus]
MKRMVLIGASVLSILFGAQPAQAQSAWVPDLGYTMTAGFAYANAAAELSKDDLGAGSRRAAPEQPPILQPLSILWGSDINDAAEKMTQAMPAEYREAGSRLYASAGRGYTEIPGNSHKRPTLPAATAFMIASSYMVYHGRLLDGSALQQLTRQLEGEARARPDSWGQLSRAQMKDKYLEYIILGMMQYQAVQKNDRASIERLRGSAKDLLEAVFHAPADTLQIGADGLRLPR